MNNFDTIFLDLVSSLLLKGEIATIPYASNSLILVSSSLDQVELRLIEEAVLKKQQVTLITSTSLSNSKKSELLKLMTENELNQSDHQLFVYKAFKNVGHVLIGLGLLILIVLNGLPLLNINIGINSELMKLFLPLLVSYIGFVLSDFMDRLMVRKIEANPLLEVHLIKKKNFKNKDSVTILDEKRAYVTKKHDHFEFLLDTSSTNKIAQLIVEARKMGKKEKIEKDKILPWLFES